MRSDIHKELHASLDFSSPERLGFTRRAFQLLPRLQSPDILDVACGRGGPALELAKMTTGQITAIDIDEVALSEVTRRFEQEGLPERVRVLNCSVHHMDFPDESFDIIWAEACIHIVGFERGLDEWRRFLKPRSFLVVHEMAWLRPDPPDGIAAYWRKVFPGIRTVLEYATAIPLHGYDLKGHFALPEDFWWRDYYGPLESRIGELREKHGKDREIVAQLNEEQRQVDLYKRYSRWFGSAFFVMQRLG